MIRFSAVESRRQIIYQLLLFPAWVALTAVAVMLRPSESGHGTHTQLGMPPCGSVVLFHRPCPGCGLTTSVASTLHGNLSFALEANVFGPVFYALFTVLTFLGLAAWVMKKKMDIGTRPMTVLLVSLLAAYLVFGIVRFTLVSDYLPY